ncbi:hypothetical protein BDV98DRAFT_623553 [Pterulicium gracile]|uniref:GDP-fucose protein O-fucosyltransferase n=1 Tax=Pterulicium gracile TaxID=1884261 RepID=A0A5C3QCC7_9AGAR|nr:hypothetical protein BDV98DRAFT_623553 [Pterula gracilis]
MLAYKRTLVLFAALLLTSSLLLLSFWHPNLSFTLLNEPEATPEAAIIASNGPNTPASQAVVDETNELFDYDTGLDDPLHPYASLVGAPTSRFRDNLRPDKKYMTSWISAGWTNDVMTYGNLLYLALISDRIPILPMFTPSHIGGGVPPIAFGEVFDLPRLRKLLGKPILEWRDVKVLPVSYEPEDTEDLGCWNLWQTVQYREAIPRFLYLHCSRSISPDISYTQMPETVKLIPHFEHDPHASFWQLAPYAYPDARNAALANFKPQPSPLHNATLPPDEHMVCYDYLYYVCGSQPYEYDYDYSPAWNNVVQHMHWVPSLQELADKYVRTAMGISDEVSPSLAATPPYISIHIRHGDFKDWCGVVPVADCFASIDVIARRVREVQMELHDKHNIRADTVIMTSDERDPDWWASVEEMGWLRIDHTHTIERYGDWYPVFIDAVIQSGGAGFVGTDRSTMSILARRRVQSWRKSGTGVVRTIKWGTVGADDH